MFLWKRNISTYFVLPRPSCFLPLCHSNSRMMLSWLPLISLIGYFSKLLNFKTLFELLFGKPLSYKHPKVFVYLTFYSTLKKDRSKFDHNGKRCVLIGYPNGIKGYKLYDLSTHETIISRDIVFVEHIFPFDDQYQKHLNIPKPSPSLLDVTDIDHEFAINDLNASRGVPTIESHSHHQEHLPHVFSPVENSNKLQNNTRPLLRRSTIARNLPRYLDIYNHNLKEPNHKSPPIMHPISSYLATN